MGPSKGKLPRGKGWVRTGGAIDDPSMDELDEFNRNGSGVEEKLRTCDADINADLPVKRINKSEA